MKNKIIAVCVAAIVLLSFVLGATGLVKITKADIQKEERGVLCGALISFEDINPFDLKKYYEEHPEAMLNGGKLDIVDSGTEFRVYAKKTEDGTNPENIKYEFEGINGGFVFLSNEKSASFEDYIAYKTGGAFNMQFSGYLTNRDRSDLDIFLYVVAGKGPEFVHMNPVYQLEDGRVYVTTLPLTTYKISNFVVGQSTSMSLQETTTINDNGEKLTFDSKITLNIEPIEIAESFIVTQLDRDSKIIDRKEYKINQIPTQIICDKNTDYIIWENIYREADGSKKTERTMIGKDEEQFNVFTENELGLGGQNRINIEW